MLARRIKLAELAAMVFGAASLWLDNPFCDLSVLFFAGTLAAFFGPIKYGILPQYLKHDELIAGNALIEIGTFVTILLGTMFGGFLVLASTGAARCFRAPSWRSPSLAWSPPCGCRRRPAITDRRSTGTCRARP